MTRLTLIGMPGSGKSAVGKIVAGRLGWSFIDTDHCIEERFGLRLQALIDQVGTDSFSHIEEETVLNLTIPERTVTSTGGSVVYSGAAMGHLASISTVVFLDVPVEALREHIALEAPRGIVGMNEGGLEELYRQRLPLYRRYAHVTLPLGTGTPEEAAAKVLSECRLRCERTHDR